MQRPKILAAAIATVLALTGAAPALSAPANTLKEMFGDLNRCMAPVQAPVGTDVTLRFMLNRRGEVIGKPTLTHAVWPKESDPRQAAAAVAAGFDGCLPLSITDALGGAIAGRPIVFRLRTPPRQEKV